MKNKKMPQEGTNMTLSYLEVTNTQILVLASRLSFKMN
ncbi:hypothetical protein LCGC14_2604940 [marine sediment metagenome]|uniref:Uncharacterized protein n=1 Tax=marine sediment metagenome TaxID=412755 RepID=A0A0F9AVD9_9ZZZZ